MAERYVSNPSSEVEYTKKHIASISSLPGGVQYSHESAIPPEERERKVPHVQVPVVQPPETLSSSSSSSATGSSNDTVVRLNVKSLKPVLSFTISCPLTASISELKAQLHSESGTAGAPEAERQRWLFKGKAMADERLLKEYDGIKDGDTVHLSIKAGAVAAPAANAPSSSTAAATATPMETDEVTASSAVPVQTSTAPAPPPTTTTMTGTSAGASSPSKRQSLSPQPSSDTLSTLATPFNFASNPMGPPRSRTTSNSSAGRGGGGAHARVPSITLTTDFSNFDNLAGNNSTDAGTFSPSGATPGSPTSPTSAGPAGGAGAGVSASPGAPSASSDPTASPARRGSYGSSQPATPMSGHPLGHRQKSPSISIPIDLDNLELMNPRSSDRTYPVGLSAGFLSEIKDPKLWEDILEFLDNRFINLPSTPRARSSSQSSRPASPSSPAAATAASAAAKNAANATNTTSSTTTATTAGEPMLLDDGDYKEETKRVFEAWLGASKDWMNASDIARIRDHTGIWGMAGH